MTDVTDERWLRDAFDNIADAAALDPDADRPVAWHALRRRARQRTQRRIGTAVLAVATVAALGAVVSWPSGGHGPLLHTVKPSTEPRLTVVAEVGSGFVAYDGRDVWLATGNTVANDGSFVVQRRDADSGRLLGSVALPAVLVHSIAADRAGSVWVKSGGGDSGEPSRVTRIDTKTERIVFTHLLTTDGCQCAIVAGARAVWLGGYQTDRVLRLDPRTGDVATSIALPGAGYSIAVVGDRVQVGLDDSRVAVIDPATNQIERVLTLETPSRPPLGNIVSIEPVLARPGVWDSWATRSDGYAFSISGNVRVAGRTATFLRPVGVVSTTVIGTRLWAVGVDQLLFDSIDADGKTGYANYDRDTTSFGPLILRSRRFVPTVSQSPGLDAIVAAGSTLWIADSGASRILVVQTLGGKLPE